MEKVSGPLSGQSVNHIALIHSFMSAQRSLSFSFTRLNLQFVNQFSSLSFLDKLLPWHFHRQYSCDNLIFAVCATSSNLTISALVTI